MLAIHSIKKSEILEAERIDPKLIRTPIEQYHQNETTGRHESAFEKIQHEEEGEWETEV